MKELMRAFLGFMEQRDVGVERLRGFGDPRPLSEEKRRRMSLLFCSAFSHQTTCLSVRSQGLRGQEAKQMYFSVS